MFPVSWLLVLLFIIRGTIAEEPTREFPPGFKFGVGSSAYQVEGGWNADGKGPSVWDNITHFFPIITNGSNGDVACDSYHKYKTDVKMIQELGVHFYKFSISWPRILPKGTLDYVNQAGVDYYNDLIDELVKANIEPFVILFHWDIPQTLQENGGILNEHFIKVFQDYAELAFSLFGDRVKNWVTFNEPIAYCAAIIPIINSIELKALGKDEYLCGQNLLLAHANVYHVYDRQYRAKQKGRISITLSSEFSFPASNSSEDIAAAERKLQFELGWFAHPLFVGDYPKVMKKRILQKSKEQGLRESRLPRLTPLQILKIKGSLDFLCFNHYTSHLVADSSEESIVSSFTNDLGVVTTEDPSWKPSQADRLKVVPTGFRNILNFIKNNYGNVEIVITENGYPGDDTKRIEYIQLYLNALLDARYKDRVNVTGYTVWSLMDSFEWNSGYQAKYGLYEVDFEDANRQRTPKLSVQFYKNLIASKSVVAINEY